MSHQSFIFAFLQTETGILVLAFFWHFRCFVCYGWAEDFVDGFQKSSELAHLTKNYNDIHIDCCIRFVCILVWQGSFDVYELTEHGARVLVFIIIIIIIFYLFNFFYSGTNN